MRVASVKTPAIPLRRAVYWRTSQASYLQWQQAWLANGARKWRKTGARPAFPASLVLLRRKMLPNEKSENYVQGSRNTTARGAKLPRIARNPAQPKNQAVLKAPEVRERGAPREKTEK